MCSDTDDGSPIVRTAPHIMGEPAELGSIYSGPMSTKVGLNTQATLPYSIHALLDDKKSQRLHPDDCIHYGQVYTVEHIAQVKPFGMVNRSSLGALVEQFTRVYMGAIEQSLEHSSQETAHIVPGSSSGVPSHIAPVAHSDDLSFGQVDASSRSQGEIEAASISGSSYANSIAWMELIDNARAGWMSQGYTYSEADPLARDLVFQQLRSLGLPSKTTMHPVEGEAVPLRTRPSSPVPDQAALNDARVKRLLNRLDRFVELHDSELSRRVQMEQVEDSAWEALAECLQVIDVAAQKGKVNGLAQAHARLNDAYQHLRQQHEALMTDERRQLGDLSSTQFAIRNDDLLKRWRQKKLEIVDTVNKLAEDISLTTTDDRASVEAYQQMAPELKEYYRAKAQVNMIEDQLQDIEVDHVDECMARDFRADHGDHPSASEVGFQEEYAMRKDKVARGLDDAQEALRVAKAKCVSAGIIIPAEMSPEPSSDKKSTVTEASIDEPLPPHVGEWLRSRLEDGILLDPEHNASDLA